MRTPRIIIRPYVPRRPPYELQAEMIHHAIRQLKPQLESVVYAGWRRTIDTAGKRVLRFYIATASTVKEARARHTSGSQEGVWDIMSFSDTSHTDQKTPDYDGSPETDVSD